MMKAEQIKSIQVYYKKDDALVRDSTSTDIAYLRNALKQSDVDEIWASHHKTPDEALKEGLESSLECMTILKDGIPLAMFGITPTTASKSGAVIWFLSSQRIWEVRMEFLRHTCGFVGFMFHLHPEFERFYNYVDERNSVSIKWLAKCGANISNPEAFGADGLPFRYFEFRRPENV